MEAEDVGDYNGELAVLLQVVQRVEGWLGVCKVVYIIVGSKNKKLKNFYRNPAYFGLGRSLVKTHTLPWWRGFVEETIEAGYIYREAVDNPEEPYESTVLRLTNDGRCLLNRDLRFLLPRRRPRRMHVRH